MRDRRPTRPASPSATLRRNRQFWNRISDGYERHHAAALSGRRAMSWGFWRVPEGRLRLLGRTNGKDVLELGCGAGRWAVALRRRGARIVALDFSSERLHQAEETFRRAHAKIPLVEADAQHLPFRERSFDIVFCDWGAMTFADPMHTVPEASRVLRTGGVFVFSTSTPFRVLAHDRKTDRIGDRLLYNYFDLHRVDYSDETDFNLPYGEWIRLFRTNALRVEDLIELQAAPGARSGYLSPREHRWAQRWPLEAIWRTRKE